MRIRKIAPKILQLLTEWTETFPYDFRDERMMRSLKELTHRLASGDEVSPFTTAWDISLSHYPFISACRSQWKPQNFFFN